MKTYIGSNLINKIRRGTTIVNKVYKGTTLVYNFYEPESISLFARMTVQPDEALKALINNFILSAKTKGYWSKIDCLVFCNLHTKQASFLNWKGNYTNGTAASTITWNATVGFYAQVGYVVSTNFIPSTHGVNYTLNNAFFGGYFKFGVAANRYTMGTIQTGIWSSQYNNRFGAHQGQVNGVALVSNFVTTDATGLNLLERISATQIRAIERGVQNGAPQNFNASGLNTYQFAFLGLLSSGILADSGSLDWGQAYVMGGGFTDQNHLDMYNDMKYFIDNVPLVITYSPEALTLFSRMTDLGEPPTDERKIAINDCINSLKVNNLFSTQFDVLVITRGTGLASTKMNWIKDSSNAIKGGAGVLTYTKDVGYHSDGSTSYLNTKYKPFIDGILYTLNDACFGYKLSGLVSAPAVYKLHGGFDAAGANGVYGGDIFNINTTYAAYGGMTKQHELGYNCATRSSSSSSSLMINTNYNQLFNISIVGVTSAEMYMFACDLVNVPFYPVDATEIIEAYWMGKSMTQSQFIIFQTIMNTYFATF